MVFRGKDYDLSFVLSGKNKIKWAPGKMYGKVDSSQNTRFSVDCRFLLNLIGKVILIY